jgi:hypothetical protein
MTLRIEKRTIEQTGPGPYCMTDSEAAYAVSRAEAARIARAPREPEAPPPLPRSADPLLRLLADGRIGRAEYRAGQEIGTVSYLTTLCARGRQVAGYAERTDPGRPGDGAAFADMEERFRGWHDWAKAQPAIRRGDSGSLADLTLLLCVDAKTLWALRVRYGADERTILMRIQASLGQYAHLAGWSRAKAA